MADISMQYSGIEATVREIRQMRTDFRAMLTNLDALIVSMDGVWEGKAQMEFALAYRNLKPKLNKIDDLLGSYTTEMNEMIRRQQMLESATTDRILNLMF